MKTKNPTRRSLLLLPLGALLGYGVGVGLDILVTRQPDLASPLAGMFALLGAAVAYFFRVGRLLGHYTRFGLAGDRYAGRRFLRDRHPRA
jgi:hypothetical protein